MAVEDMGSGVSPVDSKCQEKPVARCKKQEHLNRRERGSLYIFEMATHGESTIQ